MQSIDKLILRLNAICNFLNECFDINFGGCCYVSYVIAKNLEKLNIPYSLIIWSDEFEDDDRSEEISSAIYNRNVDCIGLGWDTCSHYCIKINDTIINQRIGDEYYSEIYNIPSKDIKWIYDTGDWNDTYKKIMNSFVNSFIKLVFDIYKFQL